MNSGNSKQIKLFLAMLTFGGFKNWFWIWKGDSGGGLGSLLFFGWVKSSCESGKNLDIILTNTLSLGCSETED